MIDWTAVFAGMTVVASVIFLVAFISIVLCAAWDTFGDWKRYRKRSQ